MISDSGVTRSLWHDSKLQLQLTSLNGHETADVCIIGAGIAGMSVAYMIAQTGKRVVVLEDGIIGGGETGRSTAHLSFAIDDTYAALQKRFGKDGARLAAESHIAAIDYIEEIVRREGIDCDFERLNGYYFNPAGKENMKLERELVAARESGVRDIAMLPTAPLPGIPTGAALRFGQQGVFHPLKYLAGLASALVSNDNQIFTNTRATSIEEKGEQFEIDTPNGRVAATQVVVATNDPIIKCDIPQRNIAYRSYAITMRCKRGAIPYALFWDTDEPYHHLRVCRYTEEEDLLLAGGCDHRTGQNGSIEESDNCLAEIEKWVRTFVPNASRPIHKWSGQVMEPIDYLAYIGRVKPNSNLYVVTGGSGHGLTHGTIAGIILADMIAGKRHKWQDIYDPMRRLGVYKRLIPYRLGNFLSWFDFLRPAGGDVDNVKRGLGKLVKHGLKWIAMYRDKQGAIYAFDARCTYSGRLLAWNALEHTWDCPCYGSRYDCRDGRVINGPSNRPLIPFKLAGI